MADTEVLEASAERRAGSSPALRTLRDNNIVTANTELLKNFNKLLILYPKLVSTGSPFYIIKRTRIATKLVFSDRSKKCIQVAKLFYEAHIGRLLTNTETIDHIDGNPLNNELNNLQLLSRAENARKGPTTEIRKRISKDNSLRMLGVGQKHIQGSNNGYSKLNEELVIKIKNDQLFHYRGQDYDLAVKYNVCRRTISSIRRGILWRHVTHNMSKDEVNNWKINSQSIPKNKKNSKIAHEQ